MTTQIQKSIPSQQEITDCVAKMAADLERYREIEKVCAKMRPQVRKLLALLDGVELPEPGPEPAQQHQANGTTPPRREPAPAPVLAEEQLPLPKSNALLCDLSSDPVSCEIIAKWLAGDRGQRNVLADRMKEIEFTEEAKVVANKGWDQSEPTYAAAYGCLRTLSNYDLGKPNEKKAAAGSMVGLFGPVFG